MSDNDVYLVKLQVRFSLTKENSVNQTKISSKSDKDVSRSQWSGRDYDEKLLLMHV